MPRLANAQVSGMSNEQQEAEPSKGRVSNGARSGGASGDVQCFRQEPLKALVSGAVVHHTSGIQH